MSGEFDPSEVYNPMSTANMLSSGLVGAGLVGLGYAAYRIAGQQGTDKDSTPQRVRTLNWWWSMVYLALVVVLLGFAMAYAYD
jgi:multisubunit Na+/H+ antiporter MnhB subunit